MNAVLHMDAVLNITVYDIVWYCTVHITGMYCYVEDPPHVDRIVYCAVIP